MANETPVVSPQKAQDDATEARLRAREAQAKASDVGKSDEQHKADKAAQDADDARAKAAQAEADARLSSEKAMTVAEAGVVAPHVDPDTLASDPRAVKLGNDPANPKPANSDHANPDLQTVKVERVSPDMPEPIIAFIHPGMLGDYLRAGWSKSEG